MIATPEFKQWLEHIMNDVNVFGLTKEFSEGIEGTMTPHILVIDEHENIAMMPIELTTSEQKTTMFGLHKHLARDPNIAKGAIMISEMWIKLVSKEEFNDTRHKSIADDPERGEALMFNARRGEMQLVGMAPIVREDGKKKVGKIDKWIDPDVDYFVGRATKGAPDDKERN